MPDDRALSIDDLAPKIPDLALALILADIFSSIGWLEILYPNPMSLLN